MLSQDIVDSLFPPDLPEPDHWEHRYPPRDLPEGAKVTRFAPSPTGFLPIGGVLRRDDRRATWPTSPAASTWSAWRTPTRPG